MDRRGEFYDDREDFIDLSYEDGTPTFFSDLLTRSDSSLKSALAKIDSSVRIWAVQAPLKDEKAAKLLACHLPTILRLSHECPFDEVRSSFSKLLRELNEHGTAVPKPVTLAPSSFLPSSEVKVKSMFGSDEKVASLFMDAFLNDGRISHITQVMGYHPTYLECHIRFQNYLMHGDGPLPFHWRAMIGVLAAARHRCTPLVRLLLKSIEDVDEAKSWSQGIAHLPQKLQNLLEVNTLLAHQPWLLNHKHMEELLQPGCDSWSMGELMSALVLLAHWHAMASFVFGCGINPEIDTPEGHVYTVGAPSPSPDTGDHNGSRRDSGEAAGSQPTVAAAAAATAATATAAEEHKKTEEVAGSFSHVMNGGAVKCSVSREDIGELAENLKGIQKADEDTEDSGTEENQLERFQQMIGGCDNGEPALEGSPCPECVAPFLDEPEFCHANFADREEGSGIHPLKSFEFCWEEQGFSLVNRLYSDIGPLLDCKFSCVGSLTYNKIGDVENVDTSPFRRAIFNYIHCIKGIFHDDYCYEQVNQLLSRDFKSFVRTVTCFSEKVTPEKFHCLDMFKPSEQVHINFLLLEARLQAELLYALRALNIYITRRS